MTSIFKASKAVVSALLMVSLNGCMVIPFAVGVKQGLEQKAAKKEAEAQRQAQEDESIRSGQANLPLERASSLLTDTFVGYACQGKVPVEIRISALLQPESASGRMRLTGEITLPSQNAKPIDVIGNFNSLTGSMLIQSPRKLQIIAARDQEGTGWFGGFREALIYACCERRVAGGER